MPGENKDSISTKLLLKNKSKLKISGKQKLREFVASRPALQKMLKHILYTKDKGYQDTVYLLLSNMFYSFTASLLQRCALGMFYFPLLQLTSCPHCHSS